MREINGDPEFVFECSGCEESLVVNGPMRDALIDSGCVICGEAVRMHDFTER